MQDRTSFWLSNGDSKRVQISFSLEKFEGKMSFLSLIIVDWDNVRQYFGTQIFLKMRYYEARLAAKFANL